MVPHKRSSSAAVAVGRLDGELTHAPGPVRNGLAEAHVLGLELGGPGVDIVDHEITEVVVIAERRGMQRVVAFADHHPADITPEKAPTLILDRQKFEAKRVLEVAGRVRHVGTASTYMVRMISGIGGDSLLVPHPLSKRAARKCKPNFLPQSASGAERRYHVAVIRGQDPQN